MKKNMEYYEDENNYIMHDTMKYDIFVPNQINIKGLVYIINMEMKNGQIQNLNFYIHPEKEEFLRKPFIQ